jgi:hypothetical protein
VVSDEMTNTASEQWSMILQLVTSKGDIMVATKKTIQQQIEEAEAKLKKLKAKQAEQKLDTSSPGMDQLLSALEVVTKDNKCSVFDVLKSVSRIKRTGAKIEPPTKKKREAKSTGGEVKTKTVKTAPIKKT